MPAEVKKEIQLEIAHVLFTDIVGYSKLPINEQRALVERLNEIVRSTDEFQAADAAGRLIKIPTGDGITLVFYQSPEAPVECALEISRALKNHPELQLRMGIHSGPVSGVIDVTGKANVAGAGINMAQRVMDCGDAGHILLSKHVAEDLEQYPHWQPYLHELGECEVKHGVRVSVVNLYTEELGNPAVPEKLKAARFAAAAQRKRIALRRLSLAALGLLVAIAGISLLLFHYKRPLTALGLVVPEKSIAVLPFENLSEEKQNAYFADGMQDEILTDLAKIADLKVISRASVMQYKSGIARNLRQIAQELGVANVLEGSVQRAGNRVRVSAQLVDARKDVHLWAEHYDRPLDDIFAIQSEIAKAIADQLRAKFSPSEKAAIERPPTADLAAFDLYTRAKTLLLQLVFVGGQARSNLLQAIELLNQAVARDPNFLLAHCLLAYAHDFLYIANLDHAPARCSAANTAVQTALRLQPDSGEAHLALAQHFYSCSLDYDHAREELGVAQRLLPNTSQIFELTGLIDRRQGRWEDSARDLEKALQLDPRNLYFFQQMSVTLQCLRRYEQMAAVLDRALQVKPDDVVTRIGRARADLELHADTKPLHTTIEAILAEDPSAAPIIATSWLILALCERDPAAADRALVALDGNPFTLSPAIRFNHDLVEGLIARMRGDAATARPAFTAARTQQEELVRTQPDYAPALCVLGLIDAGLGRKEDALKEGRQALELLPVERDTFAGPEIIHLFSIICAWTGEKDLACEQLATATQYPNFLSTYGRVRLLPFWDPLRGDPRFEKIVEEAKQPVALKEAASK
jgi:TolB-like protein/class 3 adenylate cyclase/Tfp pilus assembly protein PilF